MNRAACGFIAGAAVWLLAACGGSRLVTVPSAPPKANATSVPVNFPPPPAKIEEIPLSQHSSSPCVWRDGYWDWTGRRWEWQAGRAVIPPVGCYFSEPKLHWTTESLSFYRPAWYPDAASTPAPKSCAELACVPRGGSRNAVAH